MPTARFVLKEPNSKEPTLIFLMFRYDNITLKYSTGISLHKNYWNNTEQRVRETKKLKNSGQFNHTLDNLQNCVESEHRKFLNDGIYPTPDKLKSKLDECLLKKTKDSTVDFLLFINQLIKSSNKTAGTKRQYTTAYNNLTAFCSLNNRRMLFDDIDMNFYEEFIDYLTNTKKYSPNTIGTVIKNLKVFMNEAVERGLTKNYQFKSKKFKKPNEVSENIYLSIAEIKKIYEHDFSEDLKLDRVRDLFIIACYTGLRFSDLSQLTTDNINEDGTLIKIKTQKTGQLVIIPINEYIKNILKKYKGNLPPSISNEKMNLYIKDVVKEAKIKDDVLISFTKAGVQQSKVYKKHELVTVHTARRSFATNAYLANVPTISIMKITGHKTEKVFMTYIKISQEDNANKLTNHPFFN